MLTVKILTIIIKRLHDNGRKKIKFDEMSKINLKKVRQDKIKLRLYYHARTVRESRALTMDVSAEDILCR